MQYSNDISVVSAFMDDYYSISVYFSSPVDSKTASELTFFIEDKIADFSIQRILEDCVVINVEHLDIRTKYRVAWFSQSCEIIPHRILDQVEFFYNGNDLGLTHSDDGITFKVWAPVATSVTLNIYRSLESNEKESFPLFESANGTWMITVNQNLIGTFYSYNIDGLLNCMDPERDVLDPYARCVIGKSRRALILDPDLVKRLDSRPPVLPDEEAVIYELHVRDFSIDKSSGARNPGLYNALSEDDTWLNGDPESGIKTMMAHCKELGVNTLQIMPVQDFDNPEDDPSFYAWGYMPRHFNTPDGIFATDWKGDVKIKELRKTVESLHNKGFKVVLDVVYNHTAEGFGGDGIFSFNGFVPFFYYRIASNGHVSNGSGCGNEMRSESPMVRKFIVESLIYWTEVYGFDGYRFDLMGLIDLETMKEVVNRLKEVKPDILIYGEPWTGGITPINPTYKGMQKNLGFSVFNDEFRDAIKGPVFDALEPGYVQSKGHCYKEKIIQGILGSINNFTRNPCESLNYIEVHDNNTLFDKLTYTQSEHKEFKYPHGELLEQIGAMHTLSAFILLTSQGIPVLHCGQDFMRTKQGIENSYNAGDEINKIDWQRKQKFFDVFEYYRNLIRIRLAHPLLRLSDETAVRDAIHFRHDVFPSKYHECISYTLDGGRHHNDSVESLCILINPTPDIVEVKIPDGSWKKLLIGCKIYDTVNEPVGAKLSVPALSGVILYI